MFFLESQIREIVVSHEVAALKARIATLEEENNGLTQELLEMSKLDEEIAKAQERLASKLSLCNAGLEEVAELKAAIAKSAKF